MQNTAQFDLIFFRQVQHIPVKRYRFAEADDDDTFAVLRDKVCAIDDFAVDVIAQFLRQRSFDDIEGTAFFIATSGS